MDVIHSCRCCLRGAPDKDLTTPYIHLGKTEIYSHMLKNCFGIHLTVDDGECGVCWLCVDRLRDACDFKLQVQHSQVKVWKWLQEAKQNIAVEPVAASKVTDNDMKDVPMPNDSHIDPAESVTSNSDEDGMEDNTLLDAPDDGDMDHSDKDVNVEPARPVPAHGKQQLTLGCAGRLERLCGDEAPHASHASVETSHHEPRRASRVEDMPPHTAPARAGEPAYTCDTCKAQFTDKSRLIEHIQEHSLQTNKICIMYFCRICSKKFSCKALIANHVHKIERRETFICDTCNRHFSEKSVLIKHVLRHNKGYRCKLCDKTFKYNSCLITHIKKIHIVKDTYSSDMCDQRFDQRAKLNIHERTHYNEKPYCKKCNKYFATIRNLIKHQRTHDGAKPFKCEVCFHQFSQRFTLNEHRRIHTGEKPFKCEICNKSFTFKTALTKHKKIHSKSYSCEVCNEIFTERSHLVEHKKIHVRDKAYRCHDCNQKFSSKFSLQYHKITHSENKPYTCDLCKVSFKRKYNLNQHNKKHAEKKYTCSFCDKKFTHKHQLETHERTHTGAKPFICDQCGAQFSQNYILEKHKRKHTDACGESN